ALLQFGEGQPSSGEGVILIKHLVGLSIEKNAPIPWCTKFNRALGANACGAVAGNSVVPTRILVQGVDGGYIFAKSLSRLSRGSQRVVRINILAPIISAQTNAIAFSRHDVNKRVLAITTFQRRLLL